MSGCITYETFAVACCHYSCFFMRLGLLKETGCGTTRWLTEPGNFVNRFGTTRWLTDRGDILDRCGTTRWLTDRGDILDRCGTTRWLTDRGDIVDRWGNRDR